MNIVIYGLVIVSNQTSPFGYIYFQYEFMGTHLLSGPLHRRSKNSSSHMNPETRYMDLTSFSLISVFNQPLMSDFYILCAACSDGYVR